MIEYAVTAVGKMVDMFEVCRETELIWLFMCLHANDSCRTGVLSYRLDYLFLV